MENSSDKPQGGPVHLALSFVAACTVVVILFTFAGVAARYWWRLEQLCHFRVQYFWLLAIAGVVLLVGRRRRMAALAGIAAVVNLAMVLPIYIPVRHDHAPAAAGSNSVRLVSFNLLGKNQQHDDVAAWLRNESADVVLLMEVQPHWLPAIESLRELYPYQHVEPRRDNFGIALLSKSPWERIETVEFGSAELPSVVAAFNSKGAPWTLVGTHPLPPSSAAAAAGRNEQLADIGQFVKLHRGRILVAGDLNLTEHSPFFGDLLRAGALRDCRQGIGIQASWSARLPGLDLPLDHVLMSGDWHVVSRRIGPHLGSDHCPVVSELLIAR